MYSITITRVGIKHNSIYKELIHKYFLEYHSYVESDASILNQ